MVPHASPRRIARIPANRNGNHAKKPAIKRASTFAKIMNFLVELSGIEPLTSSLRTRRSPS